jgi:hypothetical protein
MGSAVVHAAVSAGVLCPLGLLGDHSGVPLPMASGGVGRGAAEVGVGAWGELQERCRSCVRPVLAGNYGYCSYHRDPVTGSVDSNQRDALEMDAHGFLDADRMAARRQRVRREADRGALRDHGRDSAVRALPLVLPAEWRASVAVVAGRHAAARGGGTRRGARGEALRRETARVRLTAMDAMLGGNAAGRSSGGDGSAATANSAEGTVHTGSGGIGGAGGHGGSAGQGIGKREGATAVRAADDESDGTSVGGTALYLSTKCVVLQKRDLSRAAKNNTVPAQTADPTLLGPQASAAAAAAPSLFELALLPLGRGGEVVPPIALSQAQARWLRAASVRRGMAAVQFVQRAAREPEGMGFVDGTFAANGWADVGAAVPMHRLCSSMGAEAAALFASSGAGPSARSAPIVPVAEHLWPFWTTPPATHRSAALMHLVPPTPMSPTSRSLLGWDQMHGVLECSFRSYVNFQPRRRGDEEGGGRGRGGSLKRGDVLGGSRDEEEGVPIPVNTQFSAGAHEDKGEAARREAAHSILLQLGTDEATAAVAGGGSGGGPRRRRQPSANDPRLPRAYLAPPPDSEQQGWGVDRAALARAVAEASAAELAAQQAALARMGRSRRMARQRQQAAQRIETMQATVARDEAVAGAPSAGLRYDQPAGSGAVRRRAGEENAGMPAAARCTVRQCANEAAPGNLGYCAQCRDSAAKTTRVHLRRSGHPQVRRPATSKPGGKRQPPAAGARPMTGAELQRREAEAAVQLCDFLLRRGVQPEARASAAVRAMSAQLNAPDQQWPLQVATLAQLAATRAAGRVRPGLHVRIADGFGRSVPTGDLRVRDLQRLRPPLGAGRLQPELPWTLLMTKVTAVATGADDGESRRWLSQSQSHSKLNYLQTAPRPLPSGKQ